MTNLKLKKRKIHYRDGGEGCIKWCNDHIRVPVFIDGIPRWTKLTDLSTEINPLSGRAPLAIWEGQHEILKEALRMVNKRFVYRLIVLCWMRGDGKCEAKGSEVLMFDGTIKKVEAIKVGEQLMGDDNTPRDVLSLASGKEEMFKIIPWRGAPLTVTKDHVLSLKTRCMSRRRATLRHNGVAPHENEIIDISLRDYMKQNKYFKRKHLLFRVPIEFPEQKVSIDPYYLGLWLGDGTATNTHVTTMDNEVSDYLREYADSLGLRVSVGEKKGNKAATYRLVGERLGVLGSNTLLNRLRDYNLIKNKHIPQVYKSNSREHRLQLLAGLIDSDGTLNRNSFGIIQKSKKLAEDIAFLVRSLGFHARVTKRIKHIKSINFSGEYYGVGISGDCSIIPVRIPRKKASKRNMNNDILVTTIKEIKSVGEQEYYGFNISGNGRYVKGDFTVTHNSLLACLIQLWKFFNFPRQQIMLGANSKDQVKFVHFDIMRDMILNSPELLNIVGKRNVQEKEIKLKNKRGDIVSIIRSISSFSGIVSNISGYTFSEIFDMKKPKFFTQLDGSIRNVPNALGVIDSTVSAKEHVLYKLYSNSKKGLDKLTYFSYRCSPEGNAEDFWNAEMTQEQLNSYRTKFPPAEFDMYFKNIWESAAHKMFSPAIIEAMHYIGYQGTLGQHDLVLAACKEQIKVDKKYEKYKNNPFMLQRLDAVGNTLKMRYCQPTSDIYSLKNEYNLPKMCTLEELHKLGELYDTDFAILAGVDRADPMKKDLTSGARTIITLTAKGLPGSKSDPSIYMRNDKQVLKYFYLLLALVHVERNDIDTIKETIELGIDTYDGVDTLCTERWGMWDIGKWCEDNNIIFDPLVASYLKQKEGFSELYNLVHEGRYKVTTCGHVGFKSDDLLKEEFLMFDHDPVNKFYGSPEKSEKKGVQDDCMFSANWGLYGGRLITVDDFHERGKNVTLGQFFQNKRLIGKYK